ncbi:MAG: thioredoxin family protein [Fimbriimonadaceae bacterium]
MTTLTLAATALLALSSSQQAVQSIFGQDAPAFTLPDSTGKSHSLADYKGKYVVLEWSNHQCPYVVKHYGSGNMQATQKWAREKGVVWLTIVSSAPGKQGYVTPDQANALIKSQGFDIDGMLLDPNGAVGKSYFAKTTPHMFIVSPGQKVVYAGAIDDKPSGSVADIASANNFVKSALTEAMDGRTITVPSSRPYGCSVKY